MTVSKVSPGHFRVCFIEYEICMEKSEIVNI